MLIIGLCGGSGSGKGYISGLFSKYGVPAIDTDAVYRTMTSGPSKCMSLLRERFGEEIIEENGSLNRGKLSSLVFGENPGANERRADLNKITHACILERTYEMMHEMEKNGTKAVLIDAPLLFESGFDAMCDRTLCVVADYETRISRILSRDGISEEMAKKRIAAQISNEILIERCDYVIENGGNAEKSALLQKIEEILKELKLADEI